MKRLHFLSLRLRIARAIRRERVTAPARAHARICAALCSLFLFWTMLSAIGCSSYLVVEDMYDQPSYKTYERSDFFGDGLSARPSVPGTVARGQLHDDTPLYTGRVDGALVSQLPLAVDRALIERGQERFNIYCAVCHGPSGYGNGMVVDRGFKRPPSLHIDRLRAAPVGHYFDVMTNGFGAMPSYAVQVEPRDRWAIVAYVRALQLSQHATPDDVPEDRRRELKGATP